MNDEQIARLIDAATKARQRAHADYSKFMVGAALLDDQGVVHTGCNVENASYGLTMCAERVAIGNAVAAGARKFEGLAVALAGPGSPCGACRQVLAEFAQVLPIWLYDPDTRKTIETSLETLLPMRFEF